MEGEIKSEPVLLSDSLVSIDKLMGGKFCDNYPNACTRCKNTAHYICADGDYLIVFCADNQCLKIDSEVSKVRANKERLKAPSRDGKGNIVTGADKFKLGSMFKNASLARWMCDDNAMRIVNAWLHDTSSFLVILGNTGTGKTFLCASILNFFEEQKREIHYTNQRRFMSDIQKGFGENVTHEYSIDKISYKNILILDDLGAATNTEWQKEMLLDLIDKRYSFKKKTLITSNLNKDQLYELLGNRIASRILSKENHFLEIWQDDQRVTRYEE